MLSPQPFRSSTESSQSGTVLRCWNRVFGSRVTGSSGQRSWPGPVGSRSVWQTRCLTRFFSFCTFEERIRHLGIRGIMCILYFFTSSCLLAQILIICYFLVVHCVLHRSETFGKKHSLVAQRRQNNLLIQSTDIQWLGRVTGSKASGSGRVTGQRFRPGSISAVLVQL